MTKKGTFCYKIVLLGSASVGKTSILERYCHNQFDPVQDVTVGAAFQAETLAVGDHSVRLELWDTAGQERYKSLAPLYYRDSTAAIVVFSCAEMKTFEQAKWWISEVLSKGNPELIILVGNKTDLWKRRQVTDALARDYAAAHGFLYYECSAKNGAGIGELFLEIATRLPKEGRFIDNTDFSRSPDDGTDSTVNRPQEPRGCCS